MGRTLLTASLKKNIPWLKKKNGQEESSCRPCLQTIWNLDQVIIQIYIPVINNGLFCVTAAEYILCYRPTTEMNN